MTQCDIPKKIQAQKPVVMSCGDDGSIYIWDIETGKNLKDIKWHTNSVKGLSACLIPSSKTLASQMVIASCGWDKTAMIHILDDTLAEPEEAGCTCVLS